MDQKSLREKRYDKVLDLLINHKAKNVLEFGSGDGTFLKILRNKGILNKISGVEKSISRCNKSKKKLFNQDITIYNKSFLNITNEFSLYDTIIGIEVIEHLSMDEIEELNRVLFMVLKPKLIILTTPNRDYNINYPILYNGLRQLSHKFEFSPAEFNNWGLKIVNKFPLYSYEIYFCDEEKASQVIIFKKG